MAILFDFVEAPPFERVREGYFDDDEFGRLQAYLIRHPHAGDVVPNSGGVRKLRWPGLGRGKRGGLRVIYYLALRREQIWLLVAYGKNTQENVPSHVLRKLKETFEAASRDDG